MQFICMCVQMSCIHRYMKKKNQTHMDVVMNTFPETSLFAAYLVQNI